MAGLFSEWQSRYAERGIATFPGENKKPLIKNYSSLGLPGSSLLAAKYVDADAFGFQCGPRNGITVIDIDSPDEAMVAEAVKLFGESPVVWRTASGHHAMAFRHNGEARRIRPLAGLPIDMLGDGFAVAPPSRDAKGSYDFLEGKIEDFERLPVARQIGLERSGLHRLGQAFVREGRRHEALKAALSEEVWHVDDYESLLDRALTIGTLHYTPPLDASEVADLAIWFWQHKEKGLLRRPGHRHWTQDVRDLLLTDRDAGAILHILRVEHPGDNHRFHVANGMAKMLGMNRARFAAKRATLETLSLIVMVTRASSTRPAVYRWP